MKNATHRVVLLKNCNSSLISQAIFFLKDTAPESETKILAEAEKIVEKYMSEGTLSCSTFPETKKSSDKKNVFFIFAGIVFLSIVGAIIAIF